MAIRVYIETAIFLILGVALVSSSSFLPAPTVCGLPVDSGPCLTFIPRWYFNTTNNACQRFVYGGCQGNANNFPDFTSCFLNCGGNVRCWLQPDSGPCFGNFEKYYFNVLSQTCETFTYGGCLGNANRFDTIEDCEFQCAEGPFGNRIRNRGGVKGSGVH